MVEASRETAVEGRVTGCCCGPSWDVEPSRAQGDMVEASREMPSKDG
jgi:hypothetical protein